MYNKNNYNNIEIEIVWKDAIMAIRSDWKSDVPLKRNSGFESPSFRQILKYQVKNKGVIMAKKSKDDTKEVTEDSESSAIQNMDITDATEFAVATCICPKHNMNVFDQQSCPICKTWMTYCISEPPEETEMKLVEKWCKDKQKYWDDNEKHLQDNGYSYDSGIMKALDFVNAEKVNDLEGSLLIVRIGSDDRPAPSSEIENAYALLEKALEGVKGVRVIITDHKFTIEKVSLPQLRRLQSSVLSSVDPEDNGNSIIKDLEV